MAKQFAKRHLRIEGKRRNRKSQTLAIDDLDNPSTYDISIKAYIKRYTKSQIYEYWQYEMIASLPLPIDKEKAEEKIKDAIEIVSSWNYKNLVRSSITAQPKTKAK